MPSFDFMQVVLLLLIALLFGKDTILPGILRKLGLASAKKPEPGYDPDELAAALRKVLVDDEQSPILVKGRITRLCDEMEKMRRSVDVMSNDIAFIKGKMDKGRMSA